MATGLCPDCGSNLDLVGIRHRCIPKKVTDEKPDQSRRSNNGEARKPVADGRKRRGKISKDSAKSAKALSAQATKAIDPPPPKTGNGTIKRGPPFKGQENQTLTALKPWEKEGISRRSWYRKRQQEVKQ